MTEAHQNKPRYVNVSGTRGPRDLPSAPPFLFREVTYRVFPLKANMARLTDFCDKYLNMDVPAGICHFRPALPYVYLMVLNYGSMSAASVRAQNVGWVAQQEVTFTVPLEWWREENRRMVFKDWACVSPFIFVNDDMSVATGREIYGWSKIKAGFDALEAPLWLEDPRAPTRLFRLQVPMMSRLYAADREQLHDFLLIDRDPPPSLAMFPVNPGNPFSPLQVLPNAFRSWLGLAGDALDLMAELPIRGYRLSEEGYLPRRDLRAYGAMARKGGGMLARLLPDVFWRGNAKKLIDGDCPDCSEATKYAELFLNTITLKQFRDVEDPSQACYQALINSRMGYNRLNRSGLLGDLNILRGDPSGGYTIRVARHAAQPVVDALGLAVESLERGPEVPMAVLKPTFPFWGDVDLFYGKGEVICSRTPRYQGGEIRLSWHEETAPPGQPAVRAEGAASPSIRFNTIQGAATQSIAGPFHFPDLTLQVYPLLADPGKLREFLDHYLNQPLDSTDYGYEPFGPYVYLMVSVFGDGNNDAVMWSEANNIGWWADKQVQFCVPVKCYRGRGAERVFDGVALVAPYTFGNQGRAVISDREINGRATVQARIETHPDVWLDEAGPVAARRMLRLAAEVFPALNVGQKSEVKTLLELDQRPPLAAADQSGWRLVAERWREPLVADLKRKTLFARDHGDAVEQATALALEILTGDAPIHGLHLKQYRDSWDTDDACYQALVKTSRTITGIRAVGEIESPVFVRLHQWPDFPIGETLGLLAMQVTSDGDGVAHVLQPIRPFWLRIGMREDLGEVLCWRTAAGPWLASPGNARPLAEPAARTYFGPGALAAAGASAQGAREGAWHWLRAALREEVEALVETVIPGLAPDSAETLRKAAAAGEDEAARQARELIGLALDGAGRTAAQVLVATTAAEGWRIMEAVLRLLAAAAIPLPPGRRLSFPLALAALERLADPQLVIESMLGEFAATTATAAPLFRIPKDSFPASVDINGEDAAADSLALVEDGDWYVLRPLETADAGSPKA